MRSVTTLITLFLVLGASSQALVLPKGTTSDALAVRTLGTGPTARPIADHLRPRTDTPLTPYIARMPSPWNYHQLGVFCKLDVKLAGWLPLPMVMRLGDVQHVDRMEGKGPYRDPR